MTEVWDPLGLAVDGARRTASAGGLRIEAFGGEPQVRSVDDGVVEIAISAADGGSGAVRVEWRLPCTGATALWTPSTSGSHWLPASWSAPRAATLAKGAPVASLVGSGDAGLCTFAAFQVEAS